MEQLRRNNLDLGTAEFTAVILFYNGGTRMDDCYHVVVLKSPHTTQIPWTAMYVRNVVMDSLPKDGYNKGFTMWQVNANGKNVVPLTDDGAAINANDTIAFMPA